MQFLTHRSTRLEWLRDKGFLPSDGGLYDGSIQARAATVRHLEDRCRAMRQRGLNNDPLYQLGLHRSLFHALCSERAELFAMRRDEGRRADQAKMHMHQKLDWPLETILGINLRSDPT